MSELELKLIGVTVGLLLWGVLLWGCCDCKRSDLEEYRFGYEFYREQYDLIASRVYSDQEREAIHAKFVEGWRENMTYARPR